MRFKKGWTIRFIKCGSTSKKAIPGHPPGDPAREFHLDTSYYALFPESDRFKHEDYINDGSAEDTTGETAGRGSEKFMESKMYPKWSAEVASHNERVWDEFVRRLRTVVESGRGRFEMKN